MARITHKQAQLRFVRNFLKELGRTTVNILQTQVQFGMDSTGGSVDSLAPSTQYQRKLQGFTENDPLVRSGALLKSIKFVLQEQGGSFKWHWEYEKLSKDGIDVSEILRLGDGNKIPPRGSLTIPKSVLRGGKVYQKIYNKHLAIFKKGQPYK